MNSRVKKILLLLLAVPLVFASGRIQKSLDQDRATLGLTIAAPLQNAPPVLAFTTIALGGFRGLISNFLWIRANTPQNAVFAANPELVFLDSDDSQGFRATTERSLLADDKDEGLAILFPKLAEQWAVERNAQVGLDRLSDSDRLARLRPLGANWLLLSSNAATSFPCPYRNAVSQVCRLRPVRNSADRNLLHAAETATPIKPARSKRGDGSIWDCLYAVTRDAK